VYIDCGQESIYQMIFINILCW